MNQVDIDVDNAELGLSMDPNNLSKLSVTIKACCIAGRNVKARSYAADGLKVVRSTTAINASMGIELADALMSIWKTEKYINKETLRLNTSADRMKLLQDSKEVLDKVLSMNDKSSSHLALFKLACVKENMGLFQESLLILSDLITNQANDGVELTFIILKAAVILKSVGQSAESIEYLDYLRDEPPLASGYKKTHIIALLALVYEQIGDKYLVMMGSIYKELQEEYISDLTAAATSTSTSSTGNSNASKKGGGSGGGAGAGAAIAKKAKEMFAKKPISESSEIWEQLGVQAVDRCEYTIAAEYLAQAVIKSPNKGGTLHMLAEIYYLLGQTELSSEYAQKAYELQPASAELRNLLLLVAPEEWREKLRTAAPTVIDGNDNVMGTDRDNRIQKVKKGKTGKKDKNDSKLVPVHVSANEWEQELEQPTIEQSPVKVNAKTNIITDQTTSSPNPATTAVATSNTKGDSELRNRSNGNNDSNDNDGVVVDKKVKKKITLKYVPKPVRPPLDEDAKRYLRFINEGNTHIHFYEPSLRLIARIREPE
eukprot:gene3071-6021_t